MIFILTFSSPEEKEKFEFLYEKYKRLLLYHAHGILKDYMLAEDAVSEAYLRIYKNLHKIEDPQSNSSVAFIVTIVRNVSLTILSREKKSQTDELDDFEEDGFDLEEHTLAEISSEEIYGVINQMKEEYRSVFILKYANDLSHEKIGEMLGLSENNVTVRLHRARQQITKILRKEGFYNE